MTAYTDVDVIVFLISLDIFFAQLRFWLVDVMLFFFCRKGATNRIPIPQVLHVGVDALNGPGKMEDHYLSLNKNKTQIQWCKRWMYIPKTNPWGFCRRKFRSLTSDNMDSRKAE